MTNDTHKRSLRKSGLGPYLLITLLGMLILISGMSRAYASPLLVLLSLPMLRRPVTLIPMLFVSSWNMTFSIYGLGTYFYYFILFIIAMYFHQRQYGHYVGPKFTTLLYLLFGAYIFLGSFFSVSHVTGPSVRMMFTILSVAFVGMYRCQDRNYIYVSLFWIAITASIYFGLQMLISPVYNITEDELVDIVDDSSRPTIMNGINPNNGGQIIVILSIILFITAMRLKQFKTLIVVVLLLNLNTLIAIASRTSFYALGICFVFYLFFAVHISKTRKLFFLVLAAAGMYMLFLYIDSIESRLFVTSALEDDGSGRFVNWTLLWNDVVPVYWLQGFGYGRENYSCLGYDYDADNLYLDLLCQLGIIGSIFFYSLHFGMIRRVNAARKDSMGIEYMFFILLCFLIFGLGESVFDTPLYWVSLLLTSSLLPCQLANRTKNQNTVP